MQREPSIFQFIAAFCGKEDLSEGQKNIIQEILDDIKKEAEELE